MLQISECVPNYIRYWSESEFSRNLTVNFGNMTFRIWVKQINFSKLILDSRNQEKYGLLIRKYRYVWKERNFWKNTERWTQVLLKRQTLQNSEKILNNKSIEKWSSLISSFLQKNGKYYCYLYIQQYLHQWNKIEDTGIKTHIWTLLLLQSLQTHKMKIRKHLE